jgi:peroxiredoxin
MRLVRFWSLLLVFSLSVCAISAEVKIGDKIDNLTFKDIRYLTRSLGDLGQNQAVVFVFLNRDCPVASQFMPKLRLLEQTYAPKGVVFVGVYCAPDETIMDMASHALENEIRFHVVKDVDQSVRRALGIERVPEVAILNAEHQLIYRGRINDQYRVGGAQPKVGREDLAEALDEFLAGKPVTVTTTPVDGCKITPPREPKVDHPVTFHEHIVGIMQKRCQNCHRDGTAAPFALISYDDVADHGEMVAEVVHEERMPPWYASPHYGEFINNPGMTRAEREMVRAWVLAGKPEGDPAKAPEPLVFPTSKWRIGEPDLVVTMKQEHKIKADGYVPYINLILPYVFKADTYIEAVEILPHNARVVHHCNMAHVNLLKGKVGIDNYITSFVPGSPPMEIPEGLKGVALKIPKGSSLGLQIHYTTTGKPETNQFSIGFRYAKGKVQKTTHCLVLDFPVLAIPPGDAMHQRIGADVIPRDATLLGMATHLHLRGRDTTFVAHFPDGKSETLLQVSNYNFGWQLAYLMDRKIPGGTKIEGVVHYDNSKFNAFNPDPSRTVPYGPQSFDEMFNGFVFWVYDDEKLELTIDPKTGTVIEDKPSVAER